MDTTKSGVGHKQTNSMSKHPKEAHFCWKAIILFNNVFIPYRIMYFCNMSERMVIFVGNISGRKIITTRRITKIQMEC